MKLKVISKQSETHDGNDLPWIAVLLPQKVLENSIIDTLTTFVSVVFISETTFLSSI